MSIPPHLSAPPPFNDFGSGEYTNNYLSICFNVNCVDFNLFIENVLSSYVVLTLLSSRHHTILQEQNMIKSVPIYALNCRIR